MDEAVAREWIAVLVERGNADLQVRMRRTARRQPVILNRSVLMGLIDKLEDQLSEDPESGVKSPLDRA